MTKQEAKLLLKKRYHFQSFSPIVTTDWHEFWKLAIKDGHINEEPREGLYGEYLYGVIWVKKLSPLTLGHEFIHHLFRLIGNSDGGTRLFFDFLNCVYEEVFGFVCHKSWRNQKVIQCDGKNTSQIWMQLETILESWNDWLDWQLCRDPDN
jgi:hypothetical protein